MKKYLLFLFAMLTGSIGAWADDPTNGTFGENNLSSWKVTDDGKILTVTFASLADWGDACGGWTGQFLWSAHEATIKKVVIKTTDNTVSFSGVTDKMWKFSEAMAGVTTIDLSNLTSTNISNLTTGTNLEQEKVYRTVKNLILPAGVDLGTGVSSHYNLFTQSGSVLNATFNRGVSDVDWEMVNDGCTTLKLTGNIPSVINLGDVTGFTTIDLSDATISANISLNEDVVTAVKVASADVKSFVKEKDGTTPFDSSKIEVPFSASQTVTGGSIQSQLETYLADYTSAKTVADITSLVVTGTISSADVTYLSSLTGLETLDLSGASYGTGVTKAAIASAVSTETTVLYPASFAVSGCNVTIDMARSGGTDMSTLLSEAKAAVEAGGESGICTLTVLGELSGNDITVGLSSSAMSDATRIDLSGATLASGVSLTSLNIPSSLTSLVLPKDQTVSVGLASKLADATYLMYAYSPSSSKQNDSQAIADYIWVNKPGGLKQAADEEATIRTAVYVKIESKEALNEYDAKFGSMGISATTETNYPWQYVDMSGAVVTAEATLAATKPHDKGYRIILPDNLTGDNMAIFASNTNHGNIAALYSYSGTTLRILEITDGSYKESALHDSRIVFPGTDAIEIVSGSYNGTKYGTFGMPNSLTNNLLAAINNAASSIKSVTISDVTTDTDEPLTFTNTNLTTIQLDRVKSAYDGEWGIEGPIINVNSCTSLQTLNLINCQLKSVTAQNSSITSITLNGTGVNGDTNLSGSGLKTLTTNSSTEFVGDLDLKSTASFTSFATQAKVTGNIYLNASGVSTVDLQSVQFQNTSSKIHIDKTAEEGSEVLDALNAAGQLTIYIPTGFDKANRLHPYPMDGKTAVLADNIAELAATGSFEDTCNPKCRIDYKADTHVATVYAYTPGHFKALMEKDNNYGKFVDGAIFTFDASCKLNAEDLAALAGKDGYGNFNWNYVDLYNLPASYDDNGTTVKYEDVITGAIDILRTNNWQYKGLLLPKTVQKIGTTLIMDAENADPKLATCSQFIAYSGAINDQTLTASYIYKAADDWGISFDERLTKMMAVMNLHNEIVGTTTNWSVSTNSAIPLDLSSIPTSVTIGENTVNTSKLETVNNNMVTGTATPSIYAYPAYVDVMSNVMSATSIGKTPNLETLKVAGSLNATDIESVNNFTGGPRVLDLSEAVVDGGITKAMLESITNSNIEYIILPPGMTKDVVCGANYTNGLKTNLKAVISSTATDLVAHVQLPGSLAEARYLATGGSITAETGLISPTITGLTSVTLSGNLNASDITANPTGKKVGEEGHWGDGANNAVSIALSGEQGTITKIDLKDAVFGSMSGETRINQTDMNFSYAGLSSIRDITLPTDKTMTLIPADCFNNIVSFDDLCIPYNYKHIDNGALYGTYVSHITTTDSNGSLVDNGPRTYTLSKNLEEIGSKPADADANGVYSLSMTVFPQNRGVTDVYVLAHKVPKCYANAFPANMLYGWGGFKGGDFPYCREKYDNSSDGSMIFTVLHFPDEASFDAATTRESSYAQMQCYYTDVTKVYTKKEQTGAVDANGKEIAWPTFSETRRVYNQATNGIIWDDWKASYDVNHEVNGAFPIGLKRNEVKAATAGGDNQDANHSPLIKTSDTGYGFAGYEGWHQFVLSMASYVEPDALNATEQEYEQAGWYTFCIPFDMTESQVYEMLGVPYSNARYTYKVGGDEIKKASDAEGTDRIMPKIHTLASVTRTAGSTNVIQFRMTSNLVGGNGNYYYYAINDDNPSDSKPEELGMNAAGEKIVIKGGYPYYIRPYLPKGYKNTVNNLGQYVLTRFADKFKQAASCANTRATQEYLGNKTAEEGTWLATLKFAKPFEGHKIQALYNNGSTTAYQVHHKSSDTDTNKKYYYTFIGQFWDQPLPQYCYYTVEGSGKWYRYASGTKGYRWRPYKCVILCTQEVDDTADHPTSGKFRNNEAGHSNYPTPTTVGEQSDILDSSFKLEFLNGIDDYDFVNSSRQCMFIFDDEIMGVAENGEATTIDRLDGVDILPVNGKVYNMAGQYVGNSLEGLSKGMYVVNGKKIIVK